jgi:hypothetical protein
MDTVPDRKSPKLPQFQCRVFGDDPVAEPRCAAGAADHTVERPIARAPPFAPNRI